MNRRGFLGTLAAGSAGLASGANLLNALPSPVAGNTPGGGNAPGRLERIGLELYAVRKAMRANPEKTLHDIRAIGYTDVELLWSFKNFDRSVKQVRDTLKAEGLKAPSAHMAPETILTEWETRLEEAKQLGHQYLIVPSLPSETNKSIDAWKLWAHRFNAAGEVARRAGIWLAFHNEPDHQKKLQGEIPIEVFAKETDPKYVRLQLDCGNMLVGGGDPMAFLNRYQDRCWSFHVKNVVADKSKDTELATGSFDLKAFLSAIPDLAKKPCYVEQEGPVDEMASAKQNWEYLNALRW